MTVTTALPSRLSSVIVAIQFAATLEEVMYHDIFRTK